MDVVLQVNEFIATLNVMEWNGMSAKPISPCFHLLYSSNKQQQPHQDVFFFSLEVNETIQSKEKKKKACYISEKMVMVKLSCVGKFKVYLCSNSCKELRLGQVIREIRQKKKGKKKSPDQQLCMVYLFVYLNRNLGTQPKM